MLQLEWLEYGFSFCLLSLLRMNRTETATSSGLIADFVTKLCVCKSWFLFFHSPRYQAQNIVPPPACQTCGVQCVSTVQRGEDKHVTKVYGKSHPWWKWQGLLLTGINLPDLWQNWQSEQSGRGAYTYIQACPLWHKLSLWNILRNRNVVGKYMSCPTGRGRNLEGRHTTSGILRKERYWTVH